MPSIPSSASRRPKDREAPAADAPAPSWSESIGSTFRLGRDDQIGHLDEEQAMAYGPLATALAEVNGNSVDKYLPFSRNNYFVNKDDFFKDLQAARSKNPNLLQGVPSTANEFDKQWQEKNKNRIARDADISARSDWVPWLIGSFGAGMTDFTSYIPFGGGGSTVARGALKQAIGGAVVETVMQPSIATERARTGRELTAEEAAINIGAAGFLGGTLDLSIRSGGKLIGDNWGAIKSAPKAVQEKAWAKIIENSPALQKRLGNKIDWDAIDDADLPDLAESLIGLDSLTPDERGHIANIRREAQIDGMNPYIPDGAGMKAHYDGLAAAMERIMDDAPPTVPKARPAPVAASSGPLPRLKRSTAISSGNVSGDAFAVVKSRIGVVESGANNAAKNPKSSATGTYQFVTGTWVKLYVERYGRGGLSDGQIAAKRSSGQLQEILMTDLMNANAKSLRGNGHAADAGNLYLAHFSGSAGANKLLRADPNASARSVLGDAVIKANPFLAKMNAADVINWAHRKMTGKNGVSRSISRSNRVSVNQAALLDQTIDLEADTRSWIEKELAATDAERARLDAEDVNGSSASANFDDGLNAQPEPFDISGVDAIEPLRPIEPAARLPDAPPVEVLAVLPQLRQVVQSRSIRLDRQKEIAEALGSDVETVRSGLTALAASGEIRGRSDAEGNLRFTQIPRDNSPVDMLKFIARQGGLHPSGVNARLADVVSTKGHSLGKGGRDWDKHYVHGVGKLVRAKGKGLDEIGEDLWEAGYFGLPSATERPTESELIDAIDDAVFGRRKIYAADDQAAIEARQSRQELMSEEELHYARREFDDVATEMGFGLTDDEFGEAFDLYLNQRDFDPDTGLTIEQAIIETQNRQLEAVQRGLYDELEGDSYDLYDDELNQAWIADSQSHAENWRGQAPFARAESEGSAGGRGSRRDAQAYEPVELAPEAYKPFDDPGEGAGVTSQIDSMEHDLRAVVGRETDAAIASPASRPDYSPDDDAIPLDSTKTADLWLLSDNELEALEDGLRTAEKANIRRALGDEKFQQYEKMISDNTRSNFLGQLELDERQSLLIYGRAPDPRATADDVAEVRKAIGSIALDDSQSYLIGELIAALGKLDSAKIESVNAGLGAPWEQAAFITFRNGVLALERQGIERSAIPALIGKGYEARGIETADAEFMMEKLFGARKKRQPQQIAKSDPTDMFGGATDVKKRQALERQAEGALSNDATQKPVGSDGGLFDPDSWAQAGFRLNEEGDVVNPADLLAEFDAEAAILKTIKDCL
jgi:hypothetical protein